jgi:hypothetical protein
VKVFFAGSENITDAMDEVKRVVDNYSRELQNTHANLTVEVWKKVRGNQSPGNSRAHRVRYSSAFIM